MKCIKCLRDIPDGSVYCNLCGKKQIKEQGGAKKHKRRANGEGSVFLLPNGKYRADKTLYYVPSINGRPKRKTRSKTFIKRSDAVLWLGEKETVKANTITLKVAYDKCMEKSKAGHSTINCYNSGIAIFKDVWYKDLRDLGIDEMQGYVDACEKGRRTKENAKTALGLTFKWAIPRKYADLNIAEYIDLDETYESTKRGFTDDELTMIAARVDSDVIAMYVYCHCYLGYRPTELLKKQRANYNAAQRFFLGGIKTEAGMFRTVTVSPKIQPYIDMLTEDKPLDAFIFCDPDTSKEYTIKKYRAAFYKLLAECGIENTDRSLTPHSCRHTFATLAKRVDAPEKDKLELIGHTKEKQMQKYQDVSLEDLRKITDNI